MANPEHLEILGKGVEEWNNWRKENNSIIPILSRVDLTNVDLTEVDFTGAILTGANLTGAILSRAKFYKAFLIGTDFTRAGLIGANLLVANLTGAILVEANLCLANLTEANLTEADFTGADLTEANLIWSSIEKAKFNHCKIYGINVWDCKGEIAEQKDLIITPHGQPEVTVDNIKIAQFIYLLLENKEIRNVIDTLTSKAVLILGRFTEERKAVLDAIKDELRKRNYLPILFDFEKPASKDLTETIMTLASISKFVIADVTDAKSIPQELSHIVPHLPSLAVVPIILESQREYAMFEHFERYPWVLPLYPYSSEEDLLLLLNEKVIEPAERKVEELRR